MRIKPASSPGSIGSTPGASRNSAMSSWTALQSCRRASSRNLPTKRSSSPQPRAAANSFSLCGTTPLWATTRPRLDWKVSAIPAFARFGHLCLVAAIPTIPSTSNFANRGARMNPEKDYRGHRQVYDLKYRGYGDPLRLKGKAHREPYSVEESEYSEGRDLFEHDVAYSNGPGTDWYWKRCKATGGKANFWGRSSARFGDIDFKAADLDGIGENWPVDYAEISPWFSKAERYMGVASTIQNRPSNPDGEYLPPMPWRCIDYIIQKGAERIGVPYLPDRCAQLTVDHNNHPACHYCGNCSRGCDVGSFFSPTWFTIPDAEATKNLTLLTDALVRNVITDENGLARGGSLCEGGCTCGFLRGDGAYHVEFEVAPLAYGNREFERTARAKSMRSFVRLPGIRILAEAASPACDSRQHCGLYRRLDAALAESEKSTRREIYPRLFGLHGGRLWGVPWILRPDRRIRIAIQTRYQALLPDRHRRSDPGTVAPQPDQLRRH